MNQILKPNVNSALSAAIFSFLPFTLTGTFLLPSMAIAADKVSYSQEFQAEQTVFSEAELAQILAPIALYPDTLLSHILIASTYPLEVIAAERFLTKNSHLSETRFANKIAQQDWDESVKALASFPRIINKLSDDLTWMQRLSAAFLSLAFLMAFSSEVFPSEVFLPDLVSGFFCPSSVNSFSSFLVVITETGASYAGTY
mgnify:CR=1 FL=1